LAIANEQRLQEIKLIRGDAVVEAAWGAQIRNYVLHPYKMVKDQRTNWETTDPAMTFRVVDRAVQIHGGAGMDGDLPLACILVGLRSLRIADVPDAVHLRTVARMELKKAAKKMQSKL